MQARQSFVTRVLAGAIATASAAAAPLPEGQQWQCGSAPGGGWDCRATTQPANALPRAAPTAPVAARAEPSQPASAPEPSQPASTPAAPAPALPTGEALAVTMDWLPREQVPAGTPMPNHCRGAYVEPPLDTGGSRTVAIGTIQASSDESELLRDSEVAHFRGNVTVRQDERRLRADQATYIRAENRVDIAGNVQYREPGLLVRGDTASFHTEQSSGELTGARLVMHREHARGEANRVVRNTDRSIDLEQGRFTHCEPGDKAWELVSETIHLDRETGRGTARNAKLEVAGVPVLYTPWLSFPIDERRTSGFLWPEFTNSSQNGFDIATPYYFNLAPNYDATLVPRYLVDRGAMAGGEARYLNEYGWWTASGAYMPDDDVYEDSRWLASLQHKGTLPFGVATGIDFTEVSDEEYLRNLGATGLEVKRATHLSQGAGLVWRAGDDWTMTAQAQQYQLLDDELLEPYKMLPRVTLARGNTGEPFSPDYALTAEYTVFEHKDAAQLTGQRLYLEPTLSYPMEWAAAFVRPSLGYRAISYALDDSLCNPALATGTCTAGDDSPNVAAPVASLDAGYFLERSSRWFGTDLLQTLEPRAFYLWAEHEDHSDIPNFDSQDLTFSFSQLFRSTRFAGHDRLADANQASLSLTSRLIEDTSGEELVSASVGRIHYFDDRRVTIANVPSTVITESSSAVAAEFQVQPDESLTITTSLLWDPTEEDRNGSAAPRPEPRERGMMVHWAPDGERILNFAYRYRRDQPYVDPLGLVSYENIDQVDFSTALPIGQNWKLLARYQYDFTNDQSLEETTGIEYSSCCWALRMVYQEGLDWDQGRDYGVYVEFVLRGLGGVGRNIDSLLQKSIFGYGEYETDYRVAN
jgi:LPS-assembly protein